MPEFALGNAIAVLIVVAPAVLVLAEVFVQLVQLVAFPARLDEWHPLLQYFGQIFGMKERRWTKGLFID
jgi:hypothetical protein